MAIDAAGNLYVANAGNDTITKFDAAGNYLAAGSIAGNLDSPYGLAFDAFGNLCAANYFGQSIAKFDAQGTFLLNWATAAAPRFLAFEAVPEPSSWALGVTALMVIAAARQNGRNPPKRPIGISG